MIGVKFNETNLHIGDRIKVHSKVVEAGKMRTQVFEGILISLKGREENKMMTIRRIGAAGVGVERQWPLNATCLVKVEVLKKADKVRRSKLYYLRALKGRSAVRV